MTGQRILQLLGEEMETLTEHLNELPAFIEAINAMDDDVGRRQANVAVREAQKEFWNLGFRLRLAIAELMQLHDLFDINDPQGCVEANSIKTGASR
jgi:hypothetical protein